MKLFEPLQLRSIRLKNRIGVSAMCQYSAEEGHPGAWHLVHLGSRAVGGASIVVAEATGVEDIGRISPGDTGLYLDSHVEAWAPIAKFVKENGAVAGIQLAHAGRKASRTAPWLGGKMVSIAEGGWTPVGPSAIAFDEQHAVPKELKVEEIDALVGKFVKAAGRALAAGFQVVEIHAAHGYLLHEFLSPLSNQRTDAYGGSFENRTRLVCEVVTAVRRVWPESAPLFLRISATDWIDGGWDLAQSVQLAKLVGPLGVDLIDCSSGGIAPGAKIRVRSGYQVPFAEEIRRRTGLLTGAVGLITTAAQAHAILQEGKADVVLLAREFLRQPYWPLHAANELAIPISWPAQYLRAAPDGTPAREGVSLPDFKRCMADQHGIPE